MRSVSICRKTLHEIPFFSARSCLTTSESKKICLRSRRLSPVLTSYMISKNGENIWFQRLSPLWWSSLDCLRSNGQNFKGSLKSSKIVGLGWTLVHLFFRQIPWGVFFSSKILIFEPHGPLFLANSTKTLVGPTIIDKVLQMFLSSFEFWAKLNLIWPKFWIHIH